MKILMNALYREVVDANDMLRMKTEEGDAYLAEIEVNLLLYISCIFMNNILYSLFIIPDWNFE